MPRASRFIPLAPLLAALALALAAPPATAQSPLVRIGTGPNDQALPLVYADRGGLFARAGLNVEVSKQTNTSTEAAAISGGSLDIAEGSGLGAVVLVGKGLPFTIVSNLAMYSSDHPDAGLIVAANSPIKAPKDLEGGTLGTSGLADMNAMSTRLWLEQRGVNTSTIKYVELPASESLAALEQNRITAATVYEPFFSAAVASGKARVIGSPWDAIGKHFSDAVLFAGTSWASEHRELLGRVLRVISQAGAYAGAHENEMVPYTAQFTGLEPSVVRIIHHPIRAVAIGPDDLQPLIDAAARFKMIPNTIPADQLICSCALRR